MTGLRSFGRALRLQARAVVLLIAVVWSLRRRDTSQTLRRLCTHRRWDAIAPDDGLRAVRRAARIVPANCLAQSIALTVAFESAGASPMLVLGCRRYESNKWGAHAWVRVGDEVLDPRPSGPHSALAALDAGTDWVPTPSVTAPR
ncbi:MAG TPA: lasso peptide biosynthesis B2 protein [Acidimicrobiales bacterium]|nr:lasso peptide biosynthesis B2 protein [Acidimicrobiales bacterium]